MQALTPEQSKAVTDFIWTAAGKLVWLLLGWAFWRLRKLIKSIRPGIVADVTAAVNLHADTRMTAHEEKDDLRFQELTDRLSDIHPLRNRTHGVSHGD